MGRREAACAESESANFERKRSRKKTIQGRKNDLGFEPLENAAEEAEGAAHVLGCEGEAAKKQAQVVLIGLAHGGRRVARGQHHRADDIGEELEAGGWGAGRGWRGLDGRLFVRIGYAHGQ